MINKIFRAFACVWMSISSFSLLPISMLHIRAMRASLYSSVCLVCVCACVPAAYLVVQGVR